MFYDRLVNLCKQHNVKITPTVVLCGGSKSSPKNWENGASPNSDIVIKLAEYFGVSTDYLLLGKDAAPISDSERDLLNKFNSLSEQDKGRILERIDILVQNNNENNQRSS